MQKHRKANVTVIQKYVTKRNRGSQIITINYYRGDENGQKSVKVILE